MFKNILIPQDGSQHSKNALEYGIYFAKRFHARLIGLYVVDIVALEGPLLHDLSGSLGFEPFFNLSSKMRDVLQERGKTVLNNFSDRCKQENLTYEGILGTGIVSNEIVEKANLSDLVIIGRHGINAEFKHGLLGSTAERVIRKSPQPVLLVSDRFEEITNPLIVYDGSTSASKTLHHAGEFSKLLKLPLTVAALNGATSGKILKDAEGYLKSYHINARFVLLEGGSPDEISRYYKDNEHNLIFTGFSRHSKIYEIILGSTTEYIMRNIEGSAFLVR